MIPKNNKKKIIPLENYYHYYVLLKKKTFHKKIKKRYLSTNFRPLLSHYKHSNRLASLDKIRKKTKENQIKCAFFSPKNNQNLNFVIFKIFFF